MVGFRVTESMSQVFSAMACMTFMNQLELEHAQASRYNKLCLNNEIHMTHPLVSASASADFIPLSKLTVWSSSA